MNVSWDIISRNLFLAMLFISTGCSAGGDGIKVELGNSERYNYVVDRLDELNVDYESEGSNIFIKESDAQKVIEIVNSIPKSDEWILVSYVDRDIMSEVLKQLDEENIPYKRNRFKDDEKFIALGFKDEADQEFFRNLIFKITLESQKPE